MTGGKLRLYYHLINFAGDGSGYYTLRIGKRWLYRYRGRWCFSRYGNVIR